MREERLINAERLRLERLREGDEAWHLWGPYLSERAWGTVREDYSADGNAWDALPHDQARSRAYRWSEDGLAGVQTSNSACALRWHCGTATIRSSRSAPSASPAPRAIVARTSRSTISISTQRRRTVSCAISTSTRKRGIPTNGCSRRTDGAAAPIHPSVCSIPAPSPRIAISMWT